MIGSIYRLGNITGRTETDPDMSYTYGAGSAGPQAATGGALNPGDDLTFTYGGRGNMATKAKAGVVSHLYTFDAENRLESVETGSQTMSFAYDADGQRVMTTRHDGTILYTPFPDYEVEDPPGSGANTTRTTYRIAGQLVAVQTKVGTAAGVFYYTYADHLGNVAALSWTGGTHVSGSTARYDPFGTFTTPPSTNPSITNHGFTGHRHNNTGTDDIGLIYMNARYYMPEVGRFISPDSIVPDPQNPQSFNRYSYVRNSPLNFTDPTGHRECEIICDGEIPNWRTYQDSAWTGDWDVEQQAANSATAEAIVTNTIETVVGVLWEPADWLMAFSDGFQWYDSFGMLPLVPASVGRYADDVLPIAQRVAGGTGRAYNKSTGQGLYALLDDAGQVQYIGRGDTPARLLAHSRSSELQALQQVELARNNLTVDEARGLEQLLIDNFGLGTLVNKINGISLRNPSREGYLAAGRALVDEVLSILQGIRQ